MSMSFIMTEEEIIESYPHFMSVTPFINQKFRDTMFQHVDQLYHYTNLEGLFGIIESNGFWATHIKYLNDSKEFLHGLELCHEVIDSFQELTSEQEQFFQSLKGKLEEEDEDHFVISLCPNGDLLSQWRGYSGGQYGVSLGFDIKKLTRYTTPRDNEYIFPQKVIYNREEQKEIILSILNIGLKYIESKGLDLYFLPREIARVMKYFIILFKDASFQEENEWRIVTTNFRDSEGTHSVNFRVRKNVILPFVKLRFREAMKEEQVNLPIQNIIVGPSESSEFTIESIQYYLKERNYLGTTITPSAIPFR
jgi:hypothetical protein